MLLRDRPQADAMAGLGKQWWWWPEYCLSCRHYWRHEIVCQRGRTSLRVAQYLLTGLRAGVSRTLWLHQFAKSALGFLISAAIRRRRVGWPVPGGPISR